MIPTLTALPQLRYSPPVSVFKMRLPLHPIHAVQDRPPLTHCLFKLTAMCSVGELVLFESCVLSVIQTQVHHSHSHHISYVLTCCTHLTVKKMQQENLDQKAGNSIVSKVVHKVSCLRHIYLWQIIWNKLQGLLRWLGRVLTPGLAAWRKLHPHPRSQLFSTALDRFCTGRLLVDHLQYAWEACSV